jgi:hypothetical protein
MERKRGARNMAGRKLEARSAKDAGEPGEQIEDQDRIGRALRAVYDDVLVRPVPERLLDLIERLDRETKRREGT